MAYLLVFNELLLRSVQPVGIVNFLLWNFVLSPFFLSHFSYLVASMGLQMLWSFGLACLDAYAIKAKKDLTSPLLLSLFVVGDWVLTKLILKLMSSILLSWLLRKGFLCLLNCLDKHLKSCVLLHCFTQALKLSIWKNQTEWSFFCSFLYLW